MARVPPARDLPPELGPLLDARDSVARERAWKTFLEAYSRLILHTLRRLGGEYDAVMDRYAYVLEQLSRDEFRRLRGYIPSSQSKFSTWLVVVVHRLGLDHHRRRYGYPNPAGEGVPSAVDPRVVRRRLVDLVAERLEVAEPRSAEADQPDAPLRQREFQAVLKAALEELAPRDRLLLKLRFELELSARKVASIMEFPTPFHVYRRCNHVCQTLRARLRAAGVEDSVP